MRRDRNGLCFFCDEKFVPGHKCAASNRFHLLEVDEEREVIVVDEPQEMEPTIEEEDEKEVSEISFQAIQFVFGYQTLRVIGYCD